MTTDPALRMFEDLARRLPGKISLDPDPDIEEHVEEEDIFHTDGYTSRQVTVHGVPVTLYTIDVLSAALDRKPVTLRLWERQGKIPKALFRTKTPSGKPGIRLYSKEQILGIQAIAKEFDLLHNQRPLPHEFTQRVKELFARTKTPQGDN